LASFFKVFFIIDKYLIAFLGVVSSALPPYLSLPHDLQKESSTSFSFWLHTHSQSSFSLPSRPFFFLKTAIVGNDASTVPIKSLKILISSLNKDVWA
tara:strand:- start:665 stop:955 length:291 start_codon:yes stop_codon:yes gene_type:complete